MQQYSPKVLLVQMQFSARAITFKQRFYSAVGTVLLSERPTDINYTLERPKRAQA